MECSVAVLPPPAVSRGFERFNLFLAAVALASWWQSGLAQGAALEGFPHGSPAVAATLFVLVRLAASAIEALFYSLWWRARGARLPYGWFLVALVALSIVDRFGAGLAVLAGRSPALAPWLAPIAGLQLLGDRLAPTLRVALGGVGLLALSRVVITAWFQSAYTGRRLRGALTVTALAWIATRLAAWWVVDLARGMSPVQ